MYHCKKDFLQVFLFNIYKIKANSKLKNTQNADVKKPTDELPMDIPSASKNIITLIKIVLLLKLQIHGQT